VWRRSKPITLIEIAHRRTMYAVLRDVPPVEQV
jgi:hypothetical protein